MVRRPLKGERPERSAIVERAIVPLFCNTTLRLIRGRSTLNHRLKNCCGESWTTHPLLLSNVRVGGYGHNPQRKVTRPGCPRRHVNTLDGRILVGRLTWPS
jgi:hypothetical protein